ncbi:MAG: hypothetical protein KGH62_04280, partial [Candidatus Micrarchaeota archaeon]|nr:hypothetical protein [Candidatus Micrarchaeota archaeon]
KIAKTALSSFRGLEEVVSYREQTAFRSPFLPKLKKPLVITKLESIEDLVRRLEKRIPKQIEESKSAILPIVRAAVLEIDRKARRA